MAFSIKQWLNEVGSGTDLDAPDESYNTPIDAGALRDLEERLSDYTDTAAHAAGSRVLLWDVATAAYLPANLRTDTSQPRDFRGVMNPEDDSSVSGPVYGDIWTPTAAAP